MTTQMIKDLIHIPERVHRGDFVLKLLDVLTHPEQTVRDYVVTDQISRCFDDALAFIQTGFQTGTSKAAFLHGSFGSGKSHFMAVLHLLLQKKAAARALPELQPLVRKHDPWLEDKNLLMVPFHMIGAINMEAAVLGGYAQLVAKNHPDAPPPAVFRAEGLFRDAHNLRGKMGDEAFFAKLGRSLDTNKLSLEGGAELDVDWGPRAETSRTWTPESFEAALRAPILSPQRTALISDLVTCYFPSYRFVMEHKDQAFLSLDEGLAVISRHARDLGYHGLILFLDELILWLASRVADPGFVSREAPKISKLVEFVHPRCLPVTSFVARQRDLKEIVDQYAYGAEKEAFQDIFRSWSARFHTIELEDSNLSAIVEKRVIRVRDDSARTRLDQCFDGLRLPAETRRTLCTTHGTQKDFRKIYPFSPALVTVVIDLSSVLQRERTAIKVMIQLLVNRRHDLRAGDLIAVGDLYDAIAEEAEPFSAEVRRQYQQAGKLYRHTLLPMLESEHGISGPEVRALAPDDPRRRRFLGDELLLKTLLLTAMVPRSEPFRELTANRLAALNPGAVLGPNPAHFGGITLKKVRNWASDVGEIRLSGSDHDPLISCRLTGVDTEAVIEKARTVDQPGTRIQKVRELIFGDMGIEEKELTGLHSVKVPFRGTQRRVHLIMENIRKQPFSAFESGEEWKILMDYPFDEGDHTPNDDYSRYETVKNRFDEKGQRFRTIIWIPYHFTEELSEKLGRLVILDHLLAENRFHNYTTHLNEADRAAARNALDSQRNTLRQKIRNALYSAYGLANEDKSLVNSHDLQKQLAALEPIQLRNPVANSFREALEKLMDQAYSQTWPEHPHFGQALKKSSLNHILALVRDAMLQPGTRLVVADRAKRKLVKEIAHPLQLVDMGENAFVVKEYWKRLFQKEIDEQGGNAAVDDLRKLCTRRRGLTREVQDLLIIIFAEQTHRGFKVMEKAYLPKIGGLPGEAVLHGRDLPGQKTWDKVRDRVSALFGWSPSPMVSVTALEELELEIAGILTGRVTPVRALVTELEAVAARLGLDRAGRLDTAREVRALVNNLLNAGPEKMVEVLAELVPPTTADAMGTSFKTAGDLAATLKQTHWTILENAWRLGGDSGAKARIMRDRLAETAAHDELSVPLAAALRQALDEAAGLLAAQVPVSQPAGPPKPKAAGTATNTVPAAAGTATNAVSATGNKTGLTPAQAQRLLARLVKEAPKGHRARVDLAWSWTEVDR